MQFFFRIKTLLIKKARKCLGFTFTKFCYCVVSGSRIPPLDSMITYSKLSIFGRLERLEFRLENLYNRIIAQTDFTSVQKEYKPQKIFNMLKTLFNSNFLFMISTISPTPSWQFTVRTFLSRSVGSYKERLKIFMIKTQKPPELETVFVSWKPWSSDFL